MDDSYASEEGSIPSRLKVRSLLFAHESKKREEYFTGSSSGRGVAKHVATRELVDDKTQWSASIRRPVRPPESPTRRAGSSSRVKRLSESPSALQMTNEAQRNGLPGVEENSAANRMHQRKLLQEELQALVDPRILRDWVQDPMNADRLALALEDAHKTGSALAKLLQDPTHRSAALPHNGVASAGTSSMDYEQLEQAWARNTMQRVPKNLSLQVEMACRGMGWGRERWAGVGWGGLGWVGVAWCGVAWRGVAWRGVARDGMAWGRVAWRGVA